MNGVQVTSGSADGGGTGTGAGTGDTRNTGNSGTGNTRNTGNSGSNTEEGRPREINIVGYAKQRAAQIVELLDAVDNRTLISGEVTKGPRTALQRLPRHIRRRAMSYNIRRFPRHQRKFAASTIALSRHRKKPPCRLWRRRPRNLLLNYIRRQRANVWLETHVWHAKRFRMCRKWGYRIPLQSYQRSFRPTYRDTMRHCVVRDTSFMRCFQQCNIDVIWSSNGLDMGKKASAAANPQSITESKAQD